MCWGSKKKVQEPEKSKLNTINYSSEPQPKPEEEKKIPIPKDDGVTPGERKINEAIQKNKVGRGVGAGAPSNKISQQFAVELDGNKAESAQFISDTKSTKFPNYSTLKVENMGKMQPKELNTFFTESKPDNLDYLYLEYDGKSTSKIADSLSKILKTVRKEIYLKNFDFNDATLKSILMNSCQVEKLTFHDWKFKIKNTFKTGKLAYSLTTLNLFDCFKFKTAEFGYLFTGLKASGLAAHKFTLELSQKDFGERIEQRNLANKPKAKKGKDKADPVEKAIQDELAPLHESISFKYKIIETPDYTYKGQVIGDQIAGHGIYIYKDKGYTHHYSLDLFYQYEEKLLPNGDLFRGYVRDSEYHGLGVLI